MTTGLSVNPFRQLASPESPTGCISSAGTRFAADTLVLRQRGSSRTYSSAGVCSPHCASRRPVRAIIAAPRRRNFVRQSQNGPRTPPRPGRTVSLQGHERQFHRAGCLRCGIEYLMGVPCCVCGQPRSHAIIRREQAAYARLVVEAANYHAFWGSTGCPAKRMHLPRAPPVQVIRMRPGTAMDKASVRVLIAPGEWLRQPSRAVRSGSHVVPLLAHRIGFGQCVEHDFAQIIAGIMLDRVDTDAPLNPAAIPQCQDDPGQLFLVQHAAVRAAGRMPCRRTVTLGPEPTAKPGRRGRAYAIRRDLGGAQPARHGL